MELIVAGLIVIVLIIITLGSGTGTTVTPRPANVPAPASDPDWLQIVAVVFLLVVVGLTLLGLVVPILSKVS